MRRWAAGGASPAEYGCDDWTSVQWRERAKVGCDAVAEASAETAR